MAFQAGNIKISGSFDDLSFYPSVFGWLVRRKGGPSRKQFKTAPAFARARENSAEFTACAQAAASIRRMVVRHTAHKDKTLYHRLMKLMRLLANNDRLSRRGARDPWKGMLTVQSQSTLKEFEITNNLSLYDLLVNADILKRPQEEHKTQSAAIMVLSSLKSVGSKRKKKKMLRLFRQYPLKHRGGLDRASGLLITKCSQKQTQVYTAFG